MKNAKKLAISLMVLGVAACSATAFAACKDDEHVHTWGEWTTVTAPTCDAGGKEERVCLDDPAHKEQRDTDALGHDWGEWTEKTAADCTHAKIEERVCSRDAGHKEEQTSGEALGHDWGAWTVRDEDRPSPSAGKATRVCNADGCDGKDEKTLPPLSGGGYVVSDNTATCAEAGTEKYTYSAGGEVISFYMPAAATGKHLWDEGTLLPSGDIEYKCATCEQTYKEYPGYNVTVYAADGVTKLTGATVVIDDVEQDTNSDGVAVFEGFAHGEFDVSVFADGYSMVDKVVTGSHNDINLYLAKECNDRVISQSADGTVRYAVSIAQVEDEMGKGPESAVFTLKNTGSAAASYTITLDAPLSFAAYPDSPVNSVGFFGGGGPGDDSYSPVTVVLEPNQTFRFELTANAHLLEDAQDESAYPINFGVKVTRSAAPLKGSDIAYLCQAEVGETPVTYQSEDTTLFKLDTTKHKGGYFKLEFDDEDLTVYNLGPNAVNGAAPLANGGLIDPSDYYPVVLSVKSKSGNISFKVTVSYADGTKNMPIVLEDNTSYENTVSNDDQNREVWYSYTNEDDKAKTVTFAPDADKGGDTVVYIYNENGSTRAYTVAGGSTWFELQPGEKVLLAVTHQSNAGTVAFMFRDYDPEKDISGLDFKTPVFMQINEGVNEFTVEIPEDTEREPGAYVNTNNRFYMFKTDVPGFYTVEITPNPGPDHPDDSCTYMVTDRFTVSNPRTEKIEDYIITLNDTLYLTSQPVCIKLKSSYNYACSFTVKVTFEPLVEREHTVTVVADADVRENLTVNIKKDGEVVATGTTNASGVATITFLPGEYNVEIVGFDADNYGYNPVKTAFDKNGNNTEITLAASASYKFTVNNEQATEQTVEGLTVTVYNGDTVMATGQTDANGVFTTEKIVAGTYRVKVTGTSSSYYVKAIFTNGDEHEFEVSVLTVPTINHAASNVAEDISEGRTIVVASIRTGRYNYKFTAQESGTYTIALSGTGSKGITAIYFNDYDAGSSQNTVFSGGTFNDDMNSSLGNPVKVNEADYNTTNKGYGMITVTLNAGEFVVVALQPSNQSNKLICDIERVA